MKIGKGKKKEQIEQEKSEQEQDKQILSNAENVKNAGNVDKAENAKNAKNTENAENTESNSENAKAKKKRRHLGKKQKTDQIIRIEELEALMQKYGDDIKPEDMEDIVSMYLPHRKRRKLGAALLRLDKMHLLLLVLMLVVCILFITAFMQEKMGNFTINLNRLELYRKGVSIADTGDFKGATARLAASTVKDATNISIDDIPDNVDDIEGGHNGKNYMAYTYYLRNAGKEDLGYVASITLDSCAKGAEEAVRVAVWRNGERTVYAEPSANGDPEDGCVNFESDTVVCSYEEPDFLVGNVDKYTIVIWMEGDDPECVDRIIGGSVEFSMNIDADYDDQTSLLWKFVTDIKDTLFNDKPIDAAGNEAPNDSYYSDRVITWENRRNK